MAWPRGRRRGVGLLGAVPVISPATSKVYNPIHFDKEKV